MAWIESHQSLGKHKKLLRLAGLLKVKRVQLVGHLHYLWWWGMDNADIDGRLGDVTAFEIAEAAEWEGDPEEFVEALVSVGFVEIIDGQYTLHDWYDYAGKLNERREKERERSRLRRATDRRTTAQRPPDDQQTTVGTKPNLTQPNLDDDDAHAHADASEGDTSQPDTPALTEAPDNDEWRRLTLLVFGAAFDRYTADMLEHDCADMGVEVVMEAMRRTVERATENRSAYYRKIANGWRGKVRSLDDVRRLDEATRPPTREPPRRLSSLELAAQAKGGLAR